MASATAPVSTEAVSTEAVSTEAPAISTDLRQLAIATVERALSAGAADAEVVIAEGDEFEALIRMGEVERLKEAGSRAIGIRVYFKAENDEGMRTATTSSTDFSEAGIAHLVAGAVELAKITTPRPLRRPARARSLRLSSGRPRLI